MNKEIKRIYRSQNERIIAGVCGGIAEYFMIDPTLVRLLFLLFSFGMGSGILVYIIMVIFVPLKPLDSSEHPETSVDHLSEQARDAVEKMAGKVHHAMAGHGDTHHKHKEGFRWILGLGLVCVGLVALLSIFMPIPHMAWRMAWPVIIVLVGFLILSKN